MFTERAIGYFSSPLSKVAHPKKIHEKLNAKILKLYRLELLYKQNNV